MVSPSSLWKVPLIHLLSNLSARKTLSHQPTPIQVAYPSTSPTIIPTHHHKSQFFRHHIITQLRVQLKKFILSDDVIEQIEKIIIGVEAKSTLS